MVPVPCLVSARGGNDHLRVESIGSISISEFGLEIKESNPPPSLRPAAPSPTAGRRNAGAVGDRTQRLSFPSGVPSLQNVFASTLRLRADLRSIYLPIPTLINTDGLV